MSPQLRPGPRRLLVLLSAASLGFLAALPQAFDAPSAVAGTIPVEAALPAQGATLTASTLVLGGLVYNGVATVATTVGNLDTLELTSTSAALTGLKLDVPCQPVSGGLGGMTFSAVTPTNSTSTAANGVRLYATSVTGTMAGNTVTWTPTSPPGASTGASPAAAATASPAAAAAASPSASPSSTPTSAPSASPAGSPSASPTGSPTAARKATLPSPSPSPSPSASPSPSRTGSATAARAGSLAAATTVTAVQLGDATLSDATINLAVLQAPSLRMPGLQQTTSFCKP